jgi:formyltetrahydrofolate synthetase
MEKPYEMKFLFPDDAPIKDKIRIAATKVLGTDGIDYIPEAETKLKLYTDLGFT